jgi:spore coat polysaccharide biosynthesis protein SpsF
MERVIALIQARMGSTRLPGKVLRSAAGKPLLGHLLDRIQEAKRLTGFAVITSTLPRDDCIADYCRARCVEVFRGSELDVLQRYAQAAAHFAAEVIVRITADCPLMDPLIVDKVVEHFLLAAGKTDYVSNVHPRSFPKGMDVEVFSKKALQRAHLKSGDPYEREHVTPYFYRHPELFRLDNVSAPDGKRDPGLSLTVDTEEDFLRVEKILSLKKIK